MIENNKENTRKLSIDAYKKKKLFIEVFIADEFNSDKYDQIAEALLQAGNEMLRQKLKSFKELAMQLSQKERLALSDIVEAKIFGKALNNHDEK